jgi:hypothetical protein
LVHDDIVSLEYFHIEDQVVDIFTKTLAEAIFIKLHTFLGLQEAEIMGRFSSNVISLHESPNLCIDGGVLEHQSLMVHHTSPGFHWSRGQPTSGHSQSRDQPTHHTIRLGS